MICAPCQHENAENARFCNQCGSPLVLICAGCGHQNAPTAQFCEQCGDSLAKPAPREPVTQTAERRQATVMFSDLSGYTALNENLDPEEVEALMGRIRAAATEEVEGRGGLINQFVGDEVMAVFGIPSAHEDDSRQAVLAALALHDRVREIGRDSSIPRGRGIRLHTGIHTGLVLSRLRQDAHGQYGLTGDTVNTASRLLKQANPDEIIIGPDTHRLVEPYFEIEVQPAVALKGKEHPVVPYKVIGTTRIQSRFEASAIKGLTAHADREKELKALWGYLDGLEAGRGQVVLLTGEAGMGKSRLIYEFIKKLDRARTIVLQGRSQTHSEDTAYLPVVDALRRGLNIDYADPLEERLRKAVANVMAIDPELEKFIPHYLHLLSIPNEEYPLPRNLKGPELTAALHQALIRLVVSRTKSNPMVLILEDWHWADEASIAVVRQLALLAPGIKLLLLVSYRPSFEGNWPPQSKPVEIKLAPLDEIGCRKIMEAVLDGNEVPPHLVALVHERTGGNPYFMEELCGALKEDGTIGLENGKATITGNLEAQSLPRTVEGVIRSRLDRLQEDFRGILGRAAVIGREFSERVLMWISPQELQLDTGLTVLESMDLIQCSRVEPERAFRFKHILTQEVAYETMLKEERRDLHGKVGRAIEKLPKGHIDERVEVLAHHYSLAEDWPQAVKFALLSGEKAYSISQFRQAAGFFMRAATWARKEKPSVRRDTQLVEALLRACWCFLNLGELDRILENCAVIEPIVNILGDEEKRSRLLIAYGTAYLYKGDVKSSEHHLLPAIEKAEKSADELAMVNTKHLLGGCYLGQGLWNKADPLLSDALPIYEKHGLQDQYLFGYFLLPYPVGCSQLGFTKSVQGQIDESERLFEKATHYAECADSNLTTQLTHLQWLSLYCSLLGEIRFDAETRINRLMGIAEKSDSPFLLLSTTVIKSNIQIASGDYASARALCEKLLNAQAMKGLRTGHVANLHFNHAIACLGVADPEAARQSHKKGVELVSLSPHWYGPRFDYLQGRIIDAENGAHHDQAQACYQQSIQVDEKVGAHAFASQTKVRLASLLAKKGESARAQALIAEQAENFFRWNMPGWVNRCEKIKTSIT